MVKAAENKLENPTGGYWDILKNLNLPNYLYYKPENRLVIIKGKVSKSRKGKGRAKQVYYQTEDGLIKHASFFSRPDLKVLNREYKLNKLFDD